MMTWKTWDDVFDHYCAEGCDLSDAACRATEWQSRQADQRGAVRHEWDWRIPETPGEVISLLRRRIEVHALWRDWFESGSEESKTDTDAGTAKSNQRYINQYEAAISVIEGAVVELRGGLS